MQVPAATANNKLTSGRSSSSSTMALDRHNIFYRLLKNQTKLLAVIDYSYLAIRQVWRAESVGYSARNRHNHSQHGHCGAISRKLRKIKRRQQSTMMKLARLTFLIPLCCSVSSVSWLVVGWGRCGHRHRHPLARLLRFCCLNEFVTFWTADVSIWP